MKVVRTAKAQEDLLGVWASIAIDSEAAADRLLDQIGAKLDLLPAFPEMGVAREDLHPEFRMLLSGEYLILYRILADEIEVVRVVHGRMNLRDMIL